MTSADGMTAFVPDGDSRKDTATLLLGAARDHGLDDSRAVVAAPGGFYISDDLADLLGSDPDIDTDEVEADEADADEVEADEADADEVEADEAEDKSETEKAVDQLEAEDKSETEKAVDQLEAEQPPVENADEAVEEAVTVPAKKAAKKAATKRTSGNRAEKQNSEEE